MQQLREGFRQLSEFFTRKRDAGKEKKFKAASAFFAEERRMAEEFSTVFTSIKFFLRRLGCEFAVIAYKDPIRIDELDVEISMSYPLEDIFAIAEILDRNLRLEGSHSWREILGSGFVVKPTTSGVPQERGRITLYSGIGMTYQQAHELVS